MTIGKKKVGFESFVIPQRFRVVSLTIVFRLFSYLGVILHLQLLHLQLLHLQLLRRLAMLEL
jgi:hypothetical protein